MTASERIREARTLNGMIQREAQFTVEAGALIRGRMRREIERAAWDRGLEISAVESKGLLDSVYLFTVRGNGNTVALFVEAVQEWAREVFPETGRE